MGHPAEGQQRVRSRHGRRAGRLHAATRSRSPAGVPGRELKATACRFSVQGSRNMKIDVDACERIIEPIQSVGEMFADRILSVSGSKRTRIAVLNIATLGIQQLRQVAERMSPFPFSC